MSVKSQLRRDRRNELLAVAHIKNGTTRTGKHALGRVPVVKWDRRIPKHLLRQPR